MREGPVIQSIAGGQMAQYLKTGNPAWVDKADFDKWIAEDLTPQQLKELEDKYGPTPGAYMTRTSSAGSPQLAATRIQYGNIVLLPQPVAAIGDDNFKIVHGVPSPPPYPYINAYLWARHVFGADALMHFGTHGSLEFTPRKQVALSASDWGEALIAPYPHFYYYTIGNVGESMMAKRRSYGSLISYLTPPFDESKTRHIFTDLQQAIEKYYDLKDSRAKEEQSLVVKKLAVGLGIHRDLRLDSLLTKPYTSKEVERIDNFAEEIASEKVNGQLYVTGVPYTPAKITSTVLAMTADPIAYAKARLDRLHAPQPLDNTSNKHRFYKEYLQPAQQLVRGILTSGSVSEATVLSYGGLTKAQLEHAHALAAPKHHGGMRAAMAAAKGDSGKSGGKPTRLDQMRGGIPNAKEHGHGHPANMPEPTKKERDEIEAITELERAILNVITYRDALKNSPQLELDATINALNGGFTAPSPGGDAVANPQAVPTGRNLYAVRAESTPSQRAWSQGVQLAQSTLKAYKEQHGKYPTKVSYTFWSSEFVETEGVTIAQVLYMLGVEPVRSLAQSRMCV